MFSLDRFYHILHDNLISKFPNSVSHTFYPFGTYDSIHHIAYQKNFDQDISIPDYLSFETSPKINNWFECWFYDQEPLFDDTVSIFRFSVNKESYRQKIILLANSEKSELKNELIKSTRYYDWYYFFHGFAALDWYRNFQYYDENFFEQFDKVFICYNHLISNYRSYRLHLISNILDEGLQNHGHVSFFLKDKSGDWLEELSNPNCLLTTEAKIKIYKRLKTVDSPMIIDVDSPSGHLSAEPSTDWITKALWHVVTETIYFQPKLHLTEKIFKPIVSKRPFILVAAPGNLAYLKSYGFKTFDRWIDESYDNETDNFKRIEMITAELKKLCAMSKTELMQMHNEMREILDFNHRHFFGDFKKLIVNELVDNFCDILTRINNGRIPNNHSKYHIRYEIPEDKILEIKNRLIS